MLRRNIEVKLQRALTDTPVVLLNGPRQSGKTTLVREIAAEQGSTRYATFDDAATVSAARTDPVEFLEGLGDRVVLDEVQRVPELFPAVKVAVDRQRRAGRFLLTGSADVLSMPAISESLAGRMEPLTLWPFSQGEILGGRESFIDAMFAQRPRRPLDGDSDRKDLIAKALRGGYPPAYRRSEARRRDWFAAYVTTILQRDVRDIADIERLSSLPRLLSLIGARTASLLNVAELSRSSGIPNSTLQRYLALLEHTFMVKLVPAWSSNRSKRLVKTPKVMVPDSGLAAHLAGVTSARIAAEPDLAGPALENFVATEISKQSGWSSVRVELFHFRTHGGREVDLVLEADDGRIVGIEVNARSTVDARDFGGLNALRETAGERFHRGVVLYSGPEVLSFGPQLQALPMRSLWSYRS
jgi:uncharacterized protein